MFQYKWLLYVPLACNTRKLLNNLEHFFYLSNTWCLHFIIVLYPGLIVQRKLPSPGFQVEVVLADYDAALPARPQSETATKEAADNSSANPAPGSNPTLGGEPAEGSNMSQHPGNNDKDDVFSDNESEETGMAKAGKTKAASDASAPADAKPPVSKNNDDSHKLSSLTHKTGQVSLGDTSSVYNEPKKDAPVSATSSVDVSNPVGGVSDFKVMAADASVFSFGDEEDYESD